MKMKNSINLMKTNKIVVLVWRFESLPRYFHRLKLFQPISNHDKSTHRRPSSSSERKFRHFPAIFLRSNWSLPLTAWYLYMRFLCNRYRCLDTWMISFAVRSKNQSDISCPRFSFFSFVTFTRLHSLIKRLLIFYLLFTSMPLNDKLKVMTALKVK